MGTRTKTAKRCAQIGGLILAALPLLGAEPLWIGGGKSADGALEFYIDMANLAREGKIRRAWVLFDYSTQHMATAYSTGPYSSEKQLYVIECPGDLLGTASVVYYFERMGAGNTQGSLDIPDAKLVMHHVVPGSIEDGIHTQICAIK